MDKHSKKQNSKITFVKKLSSKKDDEIKYNPDKKISKFYQICSFKNPDTQRYDVRVVVFNEYSTIIRTDVLMYPTKECNELIKKCKPNEYKIYQTYDIDLIDLPAMDDLLVMQSPLLAD